jgi:hypothetical protein
MILPILNYFQELQQSGYESHNLSLLILETLSEYTNEDIAGEQLFKLIKPFFEVNFITHLKHESIREKIILDTMKQYSFVKHGDFLIIKNHLLELSYYDKIIHRDGKDYFFLIDLLLQNYLLHFNALETFNELKKKNDIDLSGVALSTSTTPSSIISKQHNVIKTALKSMPRNQELKIRNNIYDEYLSNPYAVDTILHTVKIVGEIKSLSSEENNFLHNSRVVINSALPITKKDILRSVNLLLPLLFKSTSVWIKMLKTNKKISINKLIDTNEILMQYLFETKNILNKNNLKQVIQVKTNFANTPLYEFQNKKNKKIHPMLEENKENQEFFDDILELIKGKIPLKESR